MVGQRQHLYIHPHVPVDIIRVFSLISDILAKSLKAKIKTSEKDDLFHNTVYSKTSLILWASTHLTLKIRCSRSTANNLSDFTNIQQTCFCLVLEKYLHCTISGRSITAFSILKQISVYLCISPSETICSRDLARFYLVRNGLREGWITSLGQLAA